MNQSKSNASKSNGINTPESHSRPQFGILSVILLMTAFATWFAYTQAADEAKAIKKELPLLYKSSYALVVSDRDQYATVTALPRWMNEDSYQLYLPTSHSYTLHLEYCEVLETGFELKSMQWPVVTTTDDPEATGRHLFGVSIRQVDGQNQIRLNFDGKELALVNRPSTMNLSSSFSDPFTESTQRTTEVPLVLVERRFSYDSDKRPALVKALNEGEQTNIKVWIEKAVQ